MKGARVMHFGAHRTDRERLAKSNRDQLYIDNKPTLPEHKNWLLRERERQRELGPEFRFNSTLQVQRIMDTLQHDIGRQYKIEDINGENQCGYSNDQAIKDFCKSNLHNFVPGIDEAQYDSDTDLKEALRRDKKIN
jgi:hypothetical protein